MEENISYNKLEKAHKFSKMIKIENYLSVFFCFTRGKII